MKQTNERLCALAQKGDAAALDSLIDNNKSFSQHEFGTGWPEP